MRFSWFGAIVSVVLLLLTNGGSLHLKERANRHSVDISIESLPETFGDWKQINSHGLDISSRKILKLDQYIRREYKNSHGDQVFLYIGYWIQQTGDHQAAKHSPRLCLPSNGWVVSWLTTETLALEDTSLSYRSIVGTTRQSSKLFHYWFFSGNRTYHQDYLALATIALERLINGRSDGGIVEIAVNIDPTLPADQAKKKATKTLRSFTSAMYPKLIKLTILL